MNKGTFTYSVLQYIPSQLHNERVNIGFIVFFPDQRRVQFSFTGSFSRLKGLFKDFKETRIKSYLVQIEENVNQINKFDTLFSINFNEVESLKSLLDYQILKSDDSALQFSPFYKSLSYTSDTQKIVADLESQFLNEYVVITPRTHFTEESLRKSFLREIIKKSPDLMSNFELDYIVHTDNNEFKFDFAWKNGSFNLVKPISFDLKEPKKIQEKSVLIYGNLSLLADLAKKENYRFDLLVAKPQIKSTFSSFDKAIKTIEEAAVNKQMYFENDLEKYAQKAYEACMG
ncbi:DUF3037 domain-containing protein [Geofilum rubicundum]|uniref:DUF3037 domain-containing protein n=1 Tax=Geofilum rubicundum JCM 15548 TaxID=1236989 RepID=A0A0E9LS37_9BACT|nr:DUF3037 domain-containing protein [Geofilum rubicundum]GAO27675.1 hypothetical protein JCM15548_14517 [Geofilum rubicundum JCM 15548]